MFPRWTLRKYLIKTLKIIGWITLSAVVFLVLLALSIQIPAVQNKLTQETVGFLKKKIGTEVSLRHISLSFPKSIVLTGLYFEDQSSDTLLYAGRLAVDTDLWGLLNHRIQLNDVELDDLHAAISRPPGDGNYNFDYIVRAFSSDTTTSVPVDTTQTAWQFSIGTVTFTNTHLTYKDGTSGDDAEFRLRMLDIQVDTLDLNQPFISFNSIELQDADLSFTQPGISPQNQPSSTIEETDTSVFAFDIDEVDLRNVQANYKNKNNGQIVRMNLGDLSLRADEIDLSKQIIRLNAFSLSNTFLSYQQEATARKRETADSAAALAPEKPWDISLRQLDFKDNNIQYYDFNVPAKRGALDFAHLWITRFNIRAEDLAWKGSDAKGKINALSLIDKSGVDITSVKGSFSLTDTSAQVRDLIFITPQSKLSLQARSTFTSLELLGKKYADAKLSVDVDQSTLSLRDLLHISPDMFDSIPLKISKNTAIDIDATVNGTVNDLAIDHLLIETLGKTSLNMSGKIRGLPARDPFMDLTLHDFHTTRTDLSAILPDTLLPQNITLPDWIRLQGKFDGTPKSPRTTFALTSDVGAINVSAVLDLKDNSEHSSYNGNISVKELQVGKLLGQQQSMGNLTMKASLEGTGLTMEELNTRVDLDVPEFEYQNYTYRDFKVNGTLERYFFSGRAALNDKNLNFILDGDLNYNTEVPEYKFTFDLKSADFKALNLSEKPLKVRGKVDVKLATNDFKIINGNLDIRKVAIYNGDVLYSVDSLLFASIDQEGQSKITIRSDLLSGDFEGTINLFSMPEAVTRHFNSYFSLRDTVYSKPTTPQNFSFNLVLKNTDLLTEVILPDLDPFVPGEIVGNFDSEQNKLDLRFDVARIHYGSVGLDSIRFNVTSNENSLDYSLALRKVSMDTLRIEALKLTGSVAHDSIRTKFTVLDSLQKDKYVLGGAFYSQEKMFRFHFLSGELILNYAPWQTPSDNALLFTSKGIAAHHFSITNINEKIELFTQQNADSATAIVFKDLNLQNITRLVEGTILADGLINGDFNIAGKGSFQSNLKVQHLNIFNRTWGDLALKFGRKENGPYEVDLGIAGENTNIHAGGKIETDSASTRLDIVATLSKFDLAIIEPLTGGQVKDIKGQLTGEMKIAGDITSPGILGTLVFNDVNFTPSFVNSKFLLKKETISFTREGIVLTDFKVLDKKNNAAMLKGTIKTKSYSDFALDLTLTAKDFQLINTKPEDNDLFYGDVSINTNARITGDLIQPKVQMAISLNEKSDFTYVVPQSEKGVLEQKGIVRFKVGKKDAFLTSINARDTATSTFTGLDLTANIELTDKEKFSIVIDPVTGDKLTVKGNSTLTLTIDPSGNMQLSGRYEITEGTYDLTFYKLVKRNFAIEKGSTITWAGDPLEATMDIRASFKVETSPMELFANESTTDAALNMYRQRLPFLVYLNIKGNLLTPDISFELDMPVDNRGYLGGGIYAKIQDINTRESDLNKQVFALLILRRFISDNVFDNGGSDVASTARRSVSKLLTEQLNRLSENVKGIELSFDVKSYEDYSNPTGQAQGQTEVQLGVSKSLLDDRLVVKVSGNVDIEGNTSNQNSFSDYIGDLALEYKMTEDGRFRITGFRNSNYDIISGELIETGVGLIYIKDYNTLRELFKANAKEK